MDGLSPALQQLVDALDRLPATPSLLSLARTLESHSIDLADLKPWVRETNATYHRAAVVRRDGYELLVITWKPGQGSPPHDHSGSVSAVKVISGTATEETYVLGEDGHAEHVSSSSIGVGSLTAWHDSGVHAIRNSGDETLITINVYSPPLRDFRRFACCSDAREHRIADRQQATPHRILIVGGGFSGTMTAAQILRKAEASGINTEIFLAERRGVVGEGIAYGTPDESHLLNVPAGRMSVWPDRPHDFVEWVSQNYRPVEPHEFLPRMWYGRYVRESFLEAMRLNRQSLCRTVLDEVRRITRHERGGWIAHFARGSSIVVDQIVLAVGHRPPADPLANLWNGSRHRYIADPWRPFACSAIQPTEPIAILGSGLTAVDALLSMQISSRTAPIYLISRRGLLPRVHAATGVRPFNITERLTETLQESGRVSVRELIRFLRAAAVQAEAEGLDWRSVVDSLRPHTPTLWRSASNEERIRFIRHLRPIWEVLRHRMAPEIGRQVQTWISGGQVQPVAGRVTSVIAGNKGLQVFVKERGEDRLTPLAVDWVINCTGPEPSNCAESNPAIGSLLLHGWVSPDELNLGLRTTAAGLSVSMSGEVISNLHIVGTLRKPDSWESTAVPELRIQAEAAAEQIVSTLQNSMSRRLHRTAA